MNHDYAKPEPQPMAGADILTEAHQLVTGPRQDSYSHPYEDYWKVAQLFQSMTGIHELLNQTVIGINDHFLGRGFADDFINDG